MIAAAFNPLTEIRSDARVRDRGQGSQDTGARRVGPRPAVRLQGSLTETIEHCNLYCRIDAGETIEHCKLFSNNIVD